jgi:hypothetical protein
VSAVAERLEKILDLRQTHEELSHLLSAEEAKQLRVSPNQTSITLTVNR